MGTSKKQTAMNAVTRRAFVYIQISNMIVNILMVVLF